MKNLLKYTLLGLALVFALCTSTSARADDRDKHHKEPPPNCHQAPEVDPSLAIGGLTLLAGTLTVARSKRAAR